MKAKVIRGGGFRGVLNYVFDVGKEATHTKNAERVGGNMAGNDPRELSREFSAVRQLRPDISKPVWHCSLSLPPGERLSAEKWEAVAVDFMRRMGFDPDTTPWVAVRHQDTDKDHIHIVASRVGLDGKVWLGQWEARRAIEATQELEREHGLTLTPGLGDARAERRKLTDKEINMAVRTGDEPPRQKLQRLLDEALADRPTALQFAERLEAAGVSVRANIASTGKFSGFSFAIDGIAFKGSQLGDKYKWSRLCEHLDYDPARDADVLRQRYGGKQYDQQVTDRSADGSDAAAARGRADAGRVATPDRGITAAAAGANGVGRAGSEGRAAGPSDGNTYGRNEADASRDRPQEQRKDAKDAAAGRGGGNGGDGGGKGNRDSGAESWSSEQRHDVAAAAGGDLRGDYVGGAYDRIIDLAAAADAASDRAGQRGAGKYDPRLYAIAPDHAAKIAAWRKQAAALGAQHYRITLIPRREGMVPRNIGRNKDGRERFWTAAEVQELIPRLRRENARGYDIYVTPIDDRYHYMVIDDMTDESLARMRTAGIKPCLVQQSSRNNYQAIVKVERRNRRDEQSLANAIVTGLNKEYGDPKFSGVIHPFRMAGFSNKKANRYNAFTRIIESWNGICSHVSNMLEALRRQVDEKILAEKVEKEKTEKAKAEKAPKKSETAAFPLRGTEEGLNRGAAAVYREIYSGTVDRVIRAGLPLDPSRVDWHVVKVMLSRGWAEEEVRQAMLIASPDIWTRHHDPADYAERTVRNAVRVLDAGEEKKQRRGQDMGM